VWTVGTYRISVEMRRRCLDLLAAGLGPMDVARATGVSKTYVYELHHSVGGVYRPPDTDYDGRYLAREERYEIARLVEAGHSVRAVAARLGRAPSTISRELRRNHDPRTRSYVPERAHRLAWQRQRRPKQSKIAADPALAAQVQQLLDQRLSPEQVSGRLPVLFPDNRRMRISPESIYQSIYVYPRGEVARELKAHLRSGRTLRKRRGRRETRGRIVGAVSIAERPEEVEGRQVPGHHEGDLIIGSTASRSAVGTIVERTSGYLTLVHLPHGRTADAVCDAVADALSAYPPFFVKSLTWDRGVEMANHADLADRTGIDIYFADPYSPWQRGSNENINGLLREYLPKGTDLNAHTADDLAAIAQQLNDRPRKRLGFLTPAEVFANLLAQDQGVATTP
jgi:IS30 family transposase